MVPLDRSGVSAPKRWQALVEKGLADAKVFRRKAKAFEKLALNGKKRRAGFNAYAALVFVDGEFRAVWRHQRLKAALEAMTGGHCAYCQACVNDNSYGPVEHFQPKALFPTLAYVIDNYFFGCQRCNLAKSDKWPAIGAYVRPDRGDPSARFRFKKTGWVKVVRGDTDGLATIADFALNRKGLRRQRKILIRERLKALRPILEMPGLTDAQRIELAKPHLAGRLTRFSEAINQNVRRAWEKALSGVPLR